MAETKKIIIEYMSLDGPNTSKQAFFDNYPVRIGRGFANDLVLSDPYICGDHFVIDFKEGHWYIHDMESVNGLTLNGEKLTAKGVKLNSGDRIIAGRMIMHVYDEDHPVIPSRRMERKSSFIKTLSRGYAGVAAFLATLGVLAFNVYADLWSSELSYTILASTLTVAFVLIVWSGVWALVGKLVRHKAKFMGQLGITSVFLFFTLLISYVADMLEFISKDSVFVDVGFYLLSFMICIWCLQGNLSLATSIRRWKRVRIATLSVFCIFLGVYATGKISAEDFVGYPEYNTLIRLSLSDMVDAGSVDEVLKNAETLFQFKE